MTCAHPIAIALCFEPSDFALPFFYTTGQKSIYNAQAHMCADTSERVFVSGVQGAVLIAGTGPLLTTPGSMLPFRSIRKPRKGALAEAQP